jgi:hypothetical protein
MPNLLLFVACEKVIVANDNVISLIALLQEINVQLAPSAVLPPEMKAAPMNWTILSVWERTPDDLGKSFEQKIVMYSSSNEVMFEAPIAAVEFKVIPPATERAGQHRNIGSAGVMPVTPGQYILKTWLREQGTTDWGNELAHYPLKVNRITPS